MPRLSSKKTISIHNCYSNTSDCKSYPTHFVMLFQKYNFVSSILNTPCGCLTIVNFTKAFTWIYKFKHHFISLLRTIGFAKFFPAFTNFGVFLVFISEYEFTCCLPWCWPQSFIVFLLSLMTKSTKSW